MTKLWGGRFKKKIDPLFEEFSKSIHYDYKLAQYDVLGSQIHLGILVKSGKITKSEGRKLLKGLSSILKAVRKASFKADKKSEDIHTYIQNELQKKVGDLALKLHTARSRNDQVAFATKVYCKVSMKKLQTEIDALRAALEALRLAKKNVDIIIPGSTHMQHAQPVYLKDYLQAYSKMIERDSSRLGYISDNLEIVMGAGALAGTPISAEEYSIKLTHFLKGISIAEKLKIKATANSIDTVSDRDFVIEIISALSILAMHLSRLAEDLIIWSTQEFDFVEISEAYCTGSSLMPQKKNADSLELIRGNTGRIYGNLVGVLTMMKGLPLTYNRDMQLDKEPLFNSFEIISQELKILQGLIKTLQFNKAKIAQQLEDEALYATDWAYDLVNKGVAFKEAHTIIGKLVRHLQDNDVKLRDISEAKLGQFSDKIIKKDLIKLTNPLVSVKSKKSIKRKKR